MADIEEYSRLYLEDDDIEEISNGRIVGSEVFENYTKFIDAYHKRIGELNDEHCRSKSKNLEEEIERDNWIMLATLYQTIGILQKLNVLNKKGIKGEEIDKLKEEYRQAKLNTELLLTIFFVFSQNERKFVDFCGNKIDVFPAYLLSGHGGRIFFTGNSHIIEKIFSDISKGSFGRLAATHGIDGNSAGQLVETKLGLIQALLNRKHRGQNIGLGEFEEIVRDAKGLPLIVKNNGCSGHMYLHSTVNQNGKAAFMIGFEGTAPMKSGRSGSHSLTGAADDITPNGGKKAEEIAFNHILQEYDPEKKLKEEDIKKLHKFFDAICKTIYDKKTSSVSIERLNDKFIKSYLKKKKIIDKELIQKIKDFADFIKENKNKPEMLGNVPFKYNSQTLVISDNFERAYNDFISGMGDNPLKAFAENYHLHKAMAGSTDIGKTREGDVGEKSKRNKKQVEKNFEAIKACVKTEELKAALGKLKIKATRLFGVVEALHSIRQSKMEVEKKDKTETKLIEVMATINVFETVNKAEAQKILASGIENLNETENKKFKKEWIKKVPEEVRLPKKPPVSQFFILGTRADKDGNIVTEFGFGDSERIKILNFLPEDLVYIRRNTLGGWAKRPENKKRFSGKMESAIEYDARERRKSVEILDHDE